MAQTLETGDVVWLKSGSPSMTVKFVNKQGTLTCTWFVDNEVREHGFEAEQLTTENPNPDVTGMAIK